MKKILKRFAVAVAAVLTLSVSVACAGEDVSQLPMLSPPQNLILIEDMLLWDEVENAEGYQVFANDEMIGETTDTNYVLTHRNLEQEAIKCKALGDDVTCRDSFFSFSVIRLAYVQPVVIEYNLAESSCYIEITSETTYIKIIGKEDEIYKDFQVNILPRESDLKIELVDVHAVASYCRSAIYSEEYNYSNICKGYNVLLISEGTSNSLYGGVGARGSNGQKGSFMVSGEDGGNGSMGSAAVTVENLIIRGSADLTLIGGDGGNGGNGGDGGEFFVGSSSTAGSGGNGGNGGYGVRANKIYFYGEAAMTLTLLGGKGGLGGKCGGNSALGEGIVYSDGISGSIGTKYDGKLMILNGIYK